MAMMTFHHHHFKFDAKLRAKGGRALSALLCISQLDERLFLDLSLDWVFRKSHAEWIFCHSMKSDGTLESMRSRLRLFILALALSGCSMMSTEEEPTDGSTAHGAAYRTDAMVIDQPMPKRDPQSLRFYFKDCNPAGSGSHYSKTSYSCSMP